MPRQPVALPHEESLEARPTAPEYGAAVDIRPLAEDRLDDFGTLLRCQPESSGCWCMWFITRVAEYHAGGDAGNQAALVELMAISGTPVGFLAYEGTEPVGWCAAGPRSRYARAIKTPTMKGRDPAEDDAAWFVPCFLIRPDRRRTGVATALLQHAVDAAAAAGATAAEGFPLSGSRARSKSADFMTGTETLFESVHFVAVRRPSNNRVVMRRSFGAVDG